MKYGFIGCGNMGGALVRAAVRSANPDQVWISNRTPAKSEALSKDTGAKVSTNEEIARECDFIFLGVKPQNIAEMLGGIQPILASRADPFVLVSMAAATSIETIRRLSRDYPVIRIMPNLPVAVGEGMTLYCSQDTDEEQLSAFREIMRYTGLLCPIEEKLIDAGSAISGCGPAFAFMFIEALADGGVRCGIRRDQAIQLAAQTLLGSARQLLESGKHPDALKDAVCSPGGTTIAGVLALEKGAFRSDSANAVIAAYERTLEMRKG